MHRLLSFFRLIFINRIAMTGAVVATSAIIADVILVLGELFLFQSNPYMGIFAYMVFPGLFVGGLCLIPAGVFVALRRRGLKISPRSLERLLEVQKVDGRHAFAVVLSLSMVNLVILGIVGYRGFHYTESTEFCGELCHEVMHPELTVYKRSPHSEIHCVECHIGPGAGWFVKSKLSGMRQVLAVLFKTYSRPIETPVHNLRPAREVCEICHRPEKFLGDRIEVVEHFEKDERNTKTYTVLNLRVGSGGEHGRPAHGIHWHVSRDIELHYLATDRKREDVVWVELREADGTRRVWQRPDREVREEEIDSHSLRLMDCVDCHNRPTHIYLPPDRALDDWLAAGQLDPDIPWLRLLAEEVLVPAYETREAAMTGIAKLPALYEERYPAVWQEYGEQIEAQVPVLQEIHRTFVYPDMNIQWNTYSSLIGHSTAHTGACFRCHNGILQDSEGNTITADCEACHHVLAQRQTDPLILQTLAGR